MKLATFLEKEFINENGIYRPLGERAELDYSDGDQIEAYMLNAIENTNDLNVGSEELYNYIHNWATLYHFSPERANLLRPFGGFLKNKDILEIGCGCGAITRFLGENNNRVLALEGSLLRARISKSRCRDIDNVFVLCQNFSEFQDEKVKFDVAMLIGVLEYSGLFFKTQKPDFSLLKKTYSALSSNGSLFIAIENKLGIKYFAGAPEDHTNIPFSGIENRYNNYSVRTYGKTELINLLRLVGFKYIDFFYPFPDYKIPKTILTEKGIQANDWNSENLLSGNIEYFQNNQYKSDFCTFLTAAELCKNKLIGDLSNSFLIVASKQRINDFFNHEAMAYTYNATRKRAFSKQNEIIDIGKKALKVVSKKIYPENFQKKRHTVSQKLKPADYIKGGLYINDLIKIINTPNFTIEQIKEWAKHYYDLLTQVSYIDAKSRKPFLSGKFIDATPFNLIKIDNNRFSFFDLEWVAKAPIQLSYVFFRGIFHSFNKQIFIQQTKNEQFKDALSFTKFILGLFLDRNDYSIEQFLKMEEEYFGPVLLGRYFFYNRNFVTKINASEKQSDKEQLSLSVQSLYMTANWKHTHNLNPDTSFSVVIDDRFEPFFEYQINNSMPPHKHFQIYFFQDKGIVKIEELTLKNEDLTLFDLAKDGVSSLDFRNMKIIYDDKLDSWYLYFYEKVSFIEWNFFKKIFSKDTILITVRCAKLSDEEVLSLQMKEILF